MLRNYLLVAWRNLRKNRTFSFINITGLALGITAALLIMLHVKEELSFDREFRNSSRIYRITQQGLGDDTRHWAATSFRLGTTMQQEIPGISSSTRLYRPYPFLVLNYTPATGEPKRFEEKGGYLADSTAINVFDLQFIRGNAQSALSGINAIILTEEMSRKYFGDEDPVGKTLLDDIQKIPFRVTGVVKAMPYNTHLHFDYLLSMSSINQYLDNASLDRKTWNGFYNYVLLDDKHTAKQVESLLPAFTERYFAKPGVATTAPSRQLHLQPISSIHLHSKLEKELSANSDIQYIYIFSIAALFILLVAAVNFVNMSTAQAFHRLKEIGMRKVIGATRSQLIRQFLGESFLIVVLSTALSLFLLYLILPFYNQLTGETLHPLSLLTIQNATILVGLMLLIGLISGSYPAWFVSRFNAIGSLKAKKVPGNSSVNLVRKGLIVFQFAVAVFMIFSTLIVYRQMNLFHNKDVGFDKEQVMAVTVYPEMWKNFGAIANAINEDQHIESWSVVSTLPGDRFSMQSFSPIANAAQQEQFSSRVMYGNDKLLSTLKISLKQGRNFENQFPDIRKNEFLLNETAVAAMKLDNPIGGQFVLDRDTGTVIGVVKDFNFASLHASVEPLVIQYNPYRANYMLVRVKAGVLPAAVSQLETTIKQLSPASVFTYTFMDEKLDLLYSSEARMSTVFKIFAALSLFISCLGLFALSAYAAHLRFKEIGIRKTLGASVSDVVFLLSKDFMLLIVLSTIIALPVGYWIMHSWLDDFAYRVNISADVFLIGAVFAILLGGLTISLQSLKAALVNPVKSLKSE